MHTRPRSTSTSTARPRPDPPKALKPHDRGKISKRKSLLTKEASKIHEIIYKTATARTLESETAVTLLDDFAELLDQQNQPRIPKQNPNWSKGQGQARYDIVGVELLLQEITKFCDANQDPGNDESLELARLLLSVPEELRLTRSSRETFEETAAPWAEGSSVRESLESLVNLEEWLLSKLLFEARIKEPQIDDETGVAVV